MGPPQRPAGPFLALGLHLVFTPNPVRKEVMKHVCLGASPRFLLRIWSGRGQRIPPFNLSPKSRDPDF